MTGILQYEQTGNSINPTTIFSFQNFTMKFRVKNIGTTDTFKIYPGLDYSEPTRQGAIGLKMQEGIIINAGEIKDLEFYITRTVLSPSGIKMNPYLAYLPSGGTGFINLGILTNISLYVIPNYWFYGGVALAGGLVGYLFKRNIKGFAIGSLIGLGGSYAFLKL